MDDVSDGSHELNCDLQYVNDGVSFLNGANSVNGANAVNGANGVNCANGVNGVNLFNHDEMQDPYVRINASYHDYYE